MIQTETKLKSHNSLTVVNLEKNKKTKLFTFCLSIVLEL